MLFFYLPAPSAKLARKLNVCEILCLLAVQYMSIELSSTSSEINKEIKRWPRGTACSQRYELWYYHEWLVFGVSKQPFDLSESSAQGCHLSGERETGFRGFAPSIANGNGFRGSVDGRIANASGEKRTKLLRSSEEQRHRKIDPPPNLPSNNDVR